MTTSPENSSRREPMVVSFPGCQVVEADFRGHTIRTDQPERHGGTGSAPAPFDLFLASIATCAGFYAFQFASTRGLPTEGLALALEPVKDEAGKRFDVFRLAVTLPEGFPAKYRKALERAIDQCAVKRHIVDPPRFEIELSD